MENIAHFIVKIILRDIRLAIDCHYISVCNLLSALALNTIDSVRANRPI